ncbi:hypothetical protein L218DRAFT_1002782 [Marasmius fiardii PR-910]|nr:hypothetical protein L218DRAFT_1002782 [Marasmius fiardii PR-910]
MAATNLSQKMGMLTLEDMLTTFQLLPEDHLTMRYMFEHEPFKILPPAYWLWKEVDHEPPIFEYGIGLTTEEAVDYAHCEVFTKGKEPS